MVTKKNETKKASKKQVTNNQNATRVVCPQCGAEFDVLAEHEHKEKNVTVLGVDSGLGTVYLPVSKRAEALNAAGVGTKKYFSMNALDGSECLMTYDDNGRPVPVDESDPVIRQIIGGGTVPNRNLFRRWVMSQVFRGMSERDYRGRLIGFSKWLERHRYEYQWKQLIDELHAQAKMYGKDMENFEARNRWFNKDVAVAMAEDFVKQLFFVARMQKTRHCKGQPYIRVKGFEKGVFVEDIDKKLIHPLQAIIFSMKSVKTAEGLEQAVRRFWSHAYGKEWMWSYKQCARWKDAYKGAGAYFTMQNLLRFHGAKFPKDNDFYERGKGGLEMLDAAAELYWDEGWRLFGLMKQMIEENHIDIEKKRKEWREAKKAACDARRKH